MFSLRQKVQAARRQLTFGAVGIFVMAVSYLSLVLQISVLGVVPWLAYIVQAILAIELNFTLNHLITWRDRPVERFSELLTRLWKFNLTRWALTVPFNGLLFGLLVKLGIHYLIANTVCIGVTTVFNYFVGDRFVFAPAKKSAARNNDMPVPPPLARKTKLTSVSVVIPVKRSQRTIRQTVDSLLAQDYPDPVEIILVGDYQDSTWVPLRDLITLNRITVIEADISCHGRDANAKRNIGLARATGEIIALTDSDMELPANWISSGVDLVNEGWDCVTGPMISAEQSFMTQYVDGNQLGSKTPRMDDDYVLHPENFGLNGCKPPITANVFVTQQLVNQVGELDDHFVISYEDYEWFRRIVDDKYLILCTGRLAAHHYHRQGFKALVREYRRSGGGCGDYVIKHRHCQFGRLRVKQLVATYVLLLAVAFAVTLSILLPFVGAVVLIGGIGLGAVSAKKAGSITGFLYPAITFAFGLAFAYGLTYRLARGVHLPHGTDILSSDALVPENDYVFEESS